MRTDNSPIRRTGAAPRRRRLAGMLGVLLGAALIVPSASTAATGGVAPASEGPAGKAKLRNGKAVPPSDAPGRIVRAIEAANEIAKGKGYCLGGGHRRWNSRCYDCSGAVSYALRGGRMVKRPMPSGSYTRWGKKGKGKWLTVYAHGGHMYAVIAGLRFDTSMTPGKGPSWSKKMRSSRGFKKRHYRGF